MEKIHHESTRWKQWKRDQVTALVREIKAKALSIHPGILVSTTGLVSYLRASQEAFQDWRFWVRENIVDFVTLMDYTHEDTERFKRCIRDAVHQLGDLKKVNIAVGSYKLIENPQVFREQWEACEESGSRGCVLFHYGDMLENPELAKPLLDHKK